MSTLAPPEHPPRPAPGAGSAPRLLSVVGHAGRPAPRAAHVAGHGPLPLPAPGHEGPFADWLAEALEAAGLRGRGGAGYLTAAKLRAARGLDRPVLVINAMESEPMSGKDEVLCTGAPHLVLDGAEALARAIGASSLVVCTPADRPGVARAVAQALAERADWSGPSLRVERLPSRYVAGHESSLVHWLGSGPALPTWRPDPRVPMRLGGRPVLVHNAETLAHVAVVARRPPAGPPPAPTVLVTVTGAVEAAGVFEIPLGLPLERLLEHTGAPRRPAGVLVGGYGGTWLAPEQLGVALDHDDLGRLGASLGPGAIVVLPPGRCPMAEVARLTAWMAAESAGQCGPCVFGLAAVAEDVEVLAFGHPGPEDLDRLRRRLSLVEGRGACRHPDGVAAMVSSALWAFTDHLRGHLTRGPCEGVSAPSVLRLPSPDTPQVPR